MAAVWRMPQTVLHDDTALQNHVMAMFEENGYRLHFVNQLARKNSFLPVRIYSLRRLSFWRVLLILSPWMLANLLTPEANPGLLVPDEGESVDCQDAKGHLLGPMIRVTILGTQYKAHLNFDSHLGHYLLQPLIFCMEGFSDAEAVLTAWNRLAGQSRRKSDLGGRSREVSRRELFTGLVEQKDLVEFS